MSPNPADLLFGIYYSGQNFHAEIHPGTAAAALLQKAFRHDRNFGSMLRKSGRGLCGSPFPQLPDKSFARDETRVCENVRIKKCRVYGFTGTAPAVRADRTQIIGSLNEPDCLAGITLQSSDDLSHFFIKGETVTVTPVILYTQKMMRAKIQDGRGF
jgi:hypothetical protein